MRVKAFLESRTSSLADWVLGAEDMAIDAISGGTQPVRNGYPVYTGARTPGNVRQDAQARARNQLRLGESRRGGVGCGDGLEA